jgi:hypothetical protein
MFARLAGTVVLAAAAATVPMAIRASTPPPAIYLTLINGWKAAPSQTAKPSIWLQKGIVHLKGAIWTKLTNTSNVPFIVPAPFRPATLVYVKTDMCTATNGRIYIEPDGTTKVQAESDPDNAKCLTSLDGATYAPSSDGFKPLKLKNGWQPYGGETGTPAVRLVAGIVRFEGAMAGGKTTSPFVIPLALRPSTTVFVPIDTNSATNGRLVIGTDGSVKVQAEVDFSNPESFTSLDGVWYAHDTSGFTALNLINGWTSSQYETVAPAIKLINGVVHFQGAIGTAGNNDAPFVLPVGFRPSRETIVPVDMCQATNGRLIIAPDGTVIVQAESAFGNAACFTSLDGASFRL